MKKLITFFLTLFVASSVWAQVSQNHKYELGDTVWYMSDNKPVFGIIYTIQKCTCIDPSNSTKYEEIEYYFGTPHSTYTGVIYYENKYWIDNKNRHYCSCCDSYDDRMDYSEIFLSKKELIESLYKKD